MPERYRRARSEEIKDKMRGIAADLKAVAESTAVVEHFNGRLAEKMTIWFWPTISAALISKYHWLIVACDSCGIVNHLDLTFKRRDPNAPICIALDDVKCPRCNGHGRNRIVRLAR